LIEDIGLSYRIIVT